jgi:hypothetical protein
VGPAQSFPVKSKAKKMEDEKYCLPSNCLKTIQLNQRNAAASLPQIFFMEILQWSMCQAATT